MEILSVTNSTDLITKSVPNGLCEEIDLFCGPVQPRLCARSSCRRPLLDKDRKNKIYCDDFCRRRAYDENAEQAERDRIQKRDHRNKMDALDWMEKHKAALDWLVLECREFVKVGKFVNFRHLWTGLRNEDYIIDDHWEKWVKEYIRENYPDLKEHIRMKERKPC